MYNARFILWPPSFSSPFWNHENLTVYTYFGHAGNCSRLMTFCKLPANNFRCVCRYSSLSWDRTTGRFIDSSVFTSGSAVEIHGVCKMVAIFSRSQCASAVTVLYDTTKSRDNIVQHNTILHTAHNGRCKIQIAQKIPKVSPTGMGGWGIHWVVYCQYLGRKCRQTVL